MNLGAYYEDIDHEKSIKYYTKAKELENHWGYYNLGNMLLENDNNDE